MNPPAKPRWFLNFFDPIQPRPTLVRVVQFHIFGWWVTAIMRHWEPGDSGPSGRCKLCRTCMAYQDGCLTITRGRIERDQAALHSIVDHRIQGDEREAGGDGHR